MAPIRLKMTEAQAALLTEQGQSWSLVDAEDRIVARGGLPFRRRSASAMTEVAPLTSDERNRRMKHGHEVLRWWIPEFNVTHQQASDRSAREPFDSARSDRQILRDHHERKRRSRHMAQRQKVIRLHKDLRLLLNVAAFLLIILGVLIAGPIGFVIGICMTLATLAFRLPSP